MTDKADKPDDLASVNYAIDEAAAFLARNPEANANPLGGLAALAFGMLHAIYEAPCHPGISMNPVSEDEKFDHDMRGDWWYCPQCRIAYQYRKQE